MEDKMGTERLFDTITVRGKYVWSRDIYLGDHWGDLATIGGVGLNL
jgi:hypothetical protein